MQETQTPKRPTRRDPAIIEAAAKKLLPEVNEWLKDGNDEAEDTSTLKDLQGAMRWDEDGYAIAKHLDQDGWSPDSRLVEILDSAAHYIIQAQEEACKVWVAENQLEGPAVESRVTWDRHPEHGEGSVVRNDPDGRSAVKFDSDTNASRTYLVPWEDLKPV